MTASHAYGMKSDCRILLVYLQTPVGRGKLASADVSAIFGPGAAPSEARVAQTLILLTRLDALLDSAAKFEASLPPGKPTPQILETHIAGFTDEFALLPGSDRVEQLRVTKTNEAAADLLANPRLPPALRSRIEDYRSSLRRTGLEPGLPFTHLLGDVQKLPGI